jgi:hypothetical protein
VLCTLFSSSSPVSRPNGSHCNQLANQGPVQSFGKSEVRTVIMKFGNGDNEASSRSTTRVSLHPNLDYKLIPDAEEALLASALASDSIPSAMANGTTIKETHNKLTVWQFMRSPAYKPMLRAVLIVMLAQQLSGINVVIFYSTSILDDILPSSSALISLIISLVNLSTTLPAASLIERSGRKALLLWSICMMGISSLFLGLGIIYSWRLISVISSLSFVAAFSVGLGPIPFLIISEFVDAEGVSAGQSFGLVTNWMATFCVVPFLPHDPL